jgi:FkbM family methyltransferase
MDGGVHKKAVLALLKGAIRLTGERGRRVIAASASLDNSLFETLERLETRRGLIKLYGIGDIPRYRAETFHTKEPETLEWIDTFKDGDVFWDIGANIGLYSLYAGLNKNIRVLSFEPAASNYYLLNKNIQINGSDNIFAYCLAFNDKTFIDVLNLSSFEFGAALSSFAVEQNYNGELFAPIFKQGTLGYSLDEFVLAYNPPFPNHIKIDVDGIEAKIIWGALQILPDARLQSIAIELEEDRLSEVEYVQRTLVDNGFKLVWKRHSEMFDGGPYEHVYNYLFRR